MSARDVIVLMKVIVHISKVIDFWRAESLLTYTGVHSIRHHLHSRGDLWTMLSSRKYIDYGFVVWFQQEEQSVTALHANAKQHQPNHSILNKLREEMLKLQMRRVHNVLIACLSILHWSYPWLHTVVCGMICLVVIWNVYVCNEMRLKGRMEVGLTVRTTVLKHVSELLCSRGSLTTLQLISRYTAGSVLTHRSLRSSQLWDVGLLRELWRWYFALTSLPSEMF